MYPKQPRGPFFIAQLVLGFGFPPTFWKDFQAFVFSHFYTDCSLRSEGFEIPISSNRHGKFLLLSFLFQLQKKRSQKRNLSNKQRLFFKCTVLLYFHIKEYFKPSHLKKKVSKNTFLQGSYINTYLPGPSKGCQLNPKGWRIDTL